MFDLLAERKIAEAIASGEFRRPAGRRPAAAGGGRCARARGPAPPEIHAINQIAELERFIARDDIDTAARAKGVRKLALLRTGVEGAYYRRVVEKLGR